MSIGDRVDRRGGGGKSPQQCEFTQNVITPPSAQNRVVFNGKINPPPHVFLRNLIYCMLLLLFIYFSPDVLNLRP